MGYRVEPDYLVYCRKRKQCERAGSVWCPYCVFNGIKRRDFFKMDYRKEVKEHGTE